MNTNRLLRRCLAALLACIAMPLMAQQGTGSGEQFPYPAMPQTLTTVEQRSHYLMTHYWDNIDFADTLRLQSAGVGEQGFVNFLDLLPRFPQSAQEALDIFTTKAFAQEPSRKIFMAYTEQYLDDHGAPTRNDLTYEWLLRSALRQDSIHSLGANQAQDNNKSQGFSLTEEERSRMGYKLKNISRNQVGQTATDFAFRDRQGGLHRISDYKGQPVVIFFYNPDCERCHYIVQGLKQEPKLKDKTILAIYPADDQQLWQQTPLELPANWTDGYSEGGEIEAKQLYYIRSTPSIYLIDSEQRVVLKDTEPQRLLEQM